MARCRHNLEICSYCVVVTDAAKRMSEAINLAATFRTWEELRDGYMAFRLDDGSTNHTVYDSYAAATSHTDATRHAYFCFRMGMGGANPKDCQIFLDVNRAAHAAGLGMREPETRRQPNNIIVSTWAYDVLKGAIDKRYKP